MSVRTQCAEREWEWEGVGEGEGGRESRKGVVGGVLNLVETECLLRCAVLSIADGLRSWREDIPERSSGLLSLRAMEVAKWTEDWVESVGESGARESASLLEDTNVREGEGEREMSREEWRAVEVGLGCGGGRGDYRGEGEGREMFGRRAIV
jgi:hypothetical protein